jgi:ribosomal protein S18 acetylase RimI-like enzyme
LLVCDADRPCGFLSAGIAGDDLEIRKIGVLPAYRRLGLGRQLLRHAMNHAPSGSRRCLIEVSSANSTGLVFYQKLGFAEIGRRSNYYSDNTAAILMEKILSAP